MGEGHNGLRRRLRRAADAADLLLERASAKRASGGNDRVRHLPAVAWMMAANGYRIVEFSDPSEASG